MVGCSFGIWFSAVVLLVVTLHGWGELSISDYSSGKVLHDGGGLNVEVAEHGVATPTSYELDAVVIHVSI